MNPVRRAVFLRGGRLALALGVWLAVPGWGDVRTCAGDPGPWIIEDAAPVGEFEPWPPRDPLAGNPASAPGRVPDDRPAFLPPPQPEAPLVREPAPPASGGDPSPPESSAREPLELGRPVPLYGADDTVWTLQVLPNGLMYRSYLAGVKEPRCAIVFNHEDRLGWIWDIALGGRVGLLRYGTDDALYPDGFQIDFEGAALLRLDPEEERDLFGTDYRFGIPLTYGDGPVRTKFGYYHLSSHMGDEFMLKNPGVGRDNYVRDSLVLGKSLYLGPALRFYGEAAWAFNSDGRAKPWEFQFGMDYSPMRPGRLRGAPFLGLNGHLRQEFDYRGAFTLQTGWQWRGQSGQLFRLGMQYYAGKSDQWEFADQYEQKVGMGIWYDF